MSESEWRNFARETHHICPECRGPMLYFVSPVGSGSEAFYVCKEMSCKYGKPPPDASDGQRRFEILWGQQWANQAVWDAMMAFRNTNKTASHIEVIEHLDKLDCEETVEGMMAWDSAVWRAAHGVEPGEQPAI